MAEDNKVWHHQLVTRKTREAQNGHRSGVLWFTGLPCSGKSTIASSVEYRLHLMGVRTIVLDGDNVRHGLCSDLGFSIADRNENIRRLGEVSKLLIEAGIIVITAFISPLREHRARARTLVGEGQFIEIFCDCPVGVCEERDVKGHYKMARAGKIKEFTGVSSPYELPESAEVVLKTDILLVEQCTEQVVDYLRNGWLPDINR
ncbi:MAG: adenylyl-sulfate kinase [Nitrospirota bacterium]